MVSAKDNGSFITKTIRSNKQASIKKGKPNSEWHWYYPSGHNWREETYVNGREDGYMKEYNDSGNCYCGRKLC
jgi:antitoxin component YwqK of YwqJK toxin-antitoxin module